MLQIIHTLVAPIQVYLHIKLKKLQSLKVQGWWNVLPTRQVALFRQQEFDSYIFGVEETRFILIRLVWKFTRAEVFVAWKILKAMDLAPKGALNYTGLEVLRSVEGLDRYEQGLLPSRSTVQKQARWLHDVGQEVIPIVPVDCPLGEMYQFDFEKKSA
jgi:hypothetical protein